MVCLEYNHHDAVTLLPAWCWFTIVSWPCPRITDPATKESFIEEVESEFVPESCGKGRRCHIYSQFLKHNI